MVCTDGSDVQGRADNRKWCIGLSDVDVAQHIGLRELMTLCMGELFSAADCVQ